MTKCHQLKLKATDGKYRLTDVCDIEGMFKVIESIPSKNVEPIKQWLAKLGSERIDETFDPSIALERTIELYKAKGYDENCIAKSEISIHCKTYCFSTLNMLYFFYRKETKKMNQDQNQPIQENSNKKSDKLNKKTGEIEIILLILSIILIFVFKSFLGAILAIICLIISISKIKKRNILTIISLIGSCLLVLFSIFSFVLAFNTIDSIIDRAKESVKQEEIAK